MTRSCTRAKTTVCRTYEVLSDVVEVLPVLVERLLEEVGLAGAPLLHLVATQHGAARRHQRRQRLGRVVAVAVQRVHRVELRRHTTRAVTSQEIPVPGP